MASARRRSRPPSACWPPARGKRTLVCEVDAKGNLADFYGVGPLSFAATEVRKNLRAMTMDTEESLKEYLSLQLRVPLLARLGPLARTFDFVANAAPGVKEILTVGKLTYEVRERNYDLVVVDASATGHVVGQLGSPVAISELVTRGRGPVPDRLDDRHPHRSRPDRSGGGDRARGDAGLGDARAARHAARTRPTSTWPPWW